jgi:hypothetical protein
MHGLINRAIQCFVTDTYDRDRWGDVVRRADLEFTDFEAMLSYEETVTDAVLCAVAQVLDRPRDTVLEDIGTYLVSHPNVEALRRLLRFGGVTFVDFLHSLDDLPDRARLAVSDLDLPQMEVREHAANRFSLTCQSPHTGFGHVMVGVLRAMADDYGALAFLEHQGGSKDCETIEITLIESAFAEGRSFDLGARAG